MIKSSLSFVFLIFQIGLLSAQTSVWKPVEGKIMSKWIDQVNPSQPLPEYPRPQLVRSDNWQNLNGLWSYAITEKSLMDIPSTFGGKILVPYPIESALSGVGRTIGKDSILWYKTEIELSKDLRGKTLLLHFGAIDWKSAVYVNGRKIGEHEGGFDPFTFDISAFLKKGKNQEIVVRVYDPTDDGPQPRGKQVNDPHGIWYTPVTGIWQTVWLESVSASHIVSVRNTPDIDQHTLKTKVAVEKKQPGDQLKVSAGDGTKVLAEKIIDVADEVILSLPNAEFWSPSQPKLYDLKITLMRRGKVIDEVSSYFAMRKISMGKDANGVQRMLLNNEFLFQYGPLDQGWWPGGLYTAPTDEALLYDIEKTKEMGFNMIRKHIKVEPARWYYHCDRLGMLVWQDMPSGDLGGNHWDNHPGQLSGRPLDRERSEESEKFYRQDWKAIMDALYPFPSIVVWVPFNEAWGQFKTDDITQWTMKYDPSRLVNSASGGNFFPVGHILDIHNYPDPSIPDPAIYGDKQILVLGEFGGLGLPIEGHTWQQKDNWGYQSFKTRDQLLNRYTRLITDLKRLIPMGLSAAVYTQTTDVEIETNGLMTYDRKIIKMEIDKIRELHKKLY